MLITWDDDDALKHGVMSLDHQAGMYRHDSIGECKLFYRSCFIK